MSVCFPFFVFLRQCLRSTERPTGDLRERMKNKRQDVDPENLKRDVDEPASPTARVSSLTFESSHMSVNV